MNTRDVILTHLVAWPYIVSREAVISDAKTYHLSSSEASMVGENNSASESERHRRAAYWLSMFQNNSLAFMKRSIELWSYEVRDKRRLSKASD